MEKRKRRGREEGERKHEGEVKRERERRTGRKGLPSLVVG